MALKTMGLVGAVFLSLALPALAHRAPDHRMPAHRPMMHCVMATGSLHAGMWRMHGEHPGAMMGRRDMMSRCKPMGPAMAGHGPMAGHMAAMMGSWLVERAHQEDQIVHQKEMRLQSSLQSLLNEILGPQVAIVRVHVAMDFTLRREHSVLYAPVMAHGKATDHFNMRDTSALVLPGSHVRRISVSVVVPPTVPAAQVAKLKSVLAAAAGLEPSRRDVLSIESLPIVAPPAAK